MSSSSELSDKQKGHEYLWYVIAWIDLLGQSDKLGYFKELPTSEEEREAFQEIADQTVGTVAFFRKLITRQRDLLCEKELIPDQFKKRPSPSEMVTYEKYSQPKIDLSFLSDGALLVVPIKEERDRSPLRDIQVMLVLLANVNLVLLEKEMPIRGGVAVGICSRMQEGDIYGSAVSCAYRLEAVIADYPRIVIDTSFRSYMDYAIDVVTQNDKEKKIRDHLIATSRQSLAKDVDGEIILNYLAPYFRSMYSQQARLKETLQRASRFMAKQIKRYENDGNRKMLQRYHRLRSYFESEKCWSPD